MVSFVSAVSSYNTKPAYKHTCTYGDTYSNVTYTRKDLLSYETKYTQK